MGSSAICFLYKGRNWRQPRRPLSLLTQNWWRAEMQEAAVTQCWEPRARQGLQLMDSGFHLPELEGGIETLGRRDHLWN